MSATQASAIEVKRWALVDDMCTTVQDLQDFYASQDWLDYLKHKDETK